LGFEELLKIGEKNVTAKIIFNLVLGKGKGKVRRGRDDLDREEKDCRSVCRTGEKKTGASARGRGGVHVTTKVREGIDRGRSSGGSRFRQRRESHPSTGQVLKIMRKNISHDECQLTSKK